MNKQKHIIFPEGKEEEIHGKQNGIRSIMHHSSVGNVKTPHKRAISTLHISLHVQKSSMSSFGSQVSFRTDFGFLRISSERVVFSRILAKIRVLFKEPGKLPPSQLFQWRKANWKIVLREFLITIHLGDSDHHRQETWQSRFQFSILEKEIQFSHLCLSQTCCSPGGHLGKVQVGSCNRKSC